MKTLIIDAAREFNSGRYFEAHEVLEEGLDDVPSEKWQLAIGLIQIAVGYHKVTQNLPSGAVRMLSLGLEKIAPFSDDAAGLHLETLRERVRSDVEHLRLGRFDGASFRRHPPRFQPKP